MSVLVTGASGFIGWHLVARLAAEGRRVTAWVRSDGVSWPGHSVTVKQVDITDARAVMAAFADAKPITVFHLAAQSYPVQSWLEPAATLRVNVEGTVNLLQAARCYDRKPLRVLAAGSSSQYVANALGTPIAEDGVCEASSPYAVSKIACDQLAILYGQAFALDVVRFRPFYWIGPRKLNDVASDIARRVVAIERGAPPQLRIGRIDTIRDIIDVEDGISALLLLAERGIAGAAYNICSGHGTSIADLIALFRTQTHMPFEIVSDPDLMRPLDELVKIGDPAHIFTLGWSPQTPIDCSLAIILEYWRGQKDLQLLHDR